MTTHFLFLIFLVCGNVLCAKEQFIVNHRNVTIETCQKEDLSICETIFLKSFSKAYESFSAADLGVNDKEIFLKNAFQDLYEGFNKRDQTLIVAKKENQIVGFAGFKQTENETEIYITQLCVDPSFWRNGIGKNLIFSVFNYFEKVDKLLVIHRKLNRLARNFYTALGFERSRYMHEGYSPDKYIGYELKLKIEEER